MSGLRMATGMCVLALVAFPGLGLAEAPATPSIPLPEVGAAYYYVSTTEKPDETYQVAVAEVFRGVAERHHRDGTMRRTLVWETLYDPTDVGLDALLADPAFRVLKFVDLTTLERVESWTVGNYVFFTAEEPFPLPQTDSALSVVGLHYYDPDIAEPGALFWGASLGAPSLASTTLQGSDFVPGAWGSNPEALELVLPAGTDGRMPLFPDGLSVSAEAATWELRSSEVVDGTTRWWHQLAPNAEEDDAASSVEVAFSTAAPLPVEVRASWPAKGGGIAKTTTVLREQRPGSGAVPWGEPPVGADAPSPVLGALTPWGPQDGGSGLTYDLEQAIRAVRADPTLLHLRTMGLQGEPVLINAVYDVRPGDSSWYPVPEARWRLTFEDAGGKDVYVESKVVLGVPGAVPVNRDAAGDGTVLGGVRPEELGGTMPTVADAERAWEAYTTNPGRAVDAVVYSLQRMEDGTLAPLLWAGWMEVAADGLPGLQGSSDFRFDLVGLRSDGRVHSGKALGIAWDFALVPLPVATGGPSPTSAPVATAPAAPPDAPLALAGLGLTALGGAAWKWLGPAYTRLDRGRILRHPVRRRLLDLVDAEPGIHFNEAQRRMAVGVSTLTHHVGLLEREGLLRSERAGGFRRLYSGRADARATRADASTRHARARALLGLVRSRPGIGLREAARELGVPATSLQWHAARLVKSGLLERREGGLYTTAA